jgi:hypothetical protein
LTFSLRIHAIDKSERAFYLKQFALTNRRHAKTLWLFVDNYTKWRQIQSIFADRMIKDTCIYIIAAVFWRAKIKNAKRLKGVVMFETSIVNFFRSTYL